MIASVAWRIGASDPTVIGWLVTIAYGVVGCLCGLRAKELRSNEGSVWKVWGGLGIAIFGLGLNKQLDLQTLLREIVSSTWGTQPWYSDRWILFGGLFVLAITVVGIASTILFRRIPQTARCLQWAIAWFGCLVIVLLARFLPFWGLSDMMNYSLIENEPNIWSLTPVQGFELVLVISIGICAMMATPGRCSDRGASVGNCKI